MNARPPKKIRTVGCDGRKHDAEVSRSSPPSLPLTFKPEPCCKRPAIATMDYMKHSPDDWWNPEARVNRCCTRCWAHWFGPVGGVKSYTRREWDAYVGVSHG